MTEDLKRQDIDDFARRNTNEDSYKNRVFNGRRTTLDEYTGKKLYYSSKGQTATVNQTRHFTTKTTANVDHVIPIDQIKDKYKGKVSKEQLKRIANSDYNLAVTSEALNKSKSNMSNHEYLYKQLKSGKPENITTTYNMLQKEIVANATTYVDINVTKVSEKVGDILNTDKKTLSKVTTKVGTTSSSIINSGTAAAVMSLTVSSINNLTLVATGEKSVKSAMKDVAQDTTGSFISAAGLDLTQYTIADIAMNCKNTDLARIFSKDLPITEISTMIMVGNSVIKFINDEISTEECVTEILMNGVGVIAYQLGMLSGGPAGAIIASVVCSQVCKVITDYKNIQKLSDERLEKVSTLAAQALVEMEHQRDVLKEMIDMKYSQWNQMLDDGFEAIFKSTLNNDSQGIATGLNTILGIIDENVTFSTQEEFDSFFDNENSVLKF